MRERDGLARALQDAHDAHEAPVRVPLARALEHGPQVFALDEAHREVETSARVEAELVHGNDARVLELPGDLRFFEEALYGARPELGERARRVLVALRQDHLHRHGAAQLRVPDP